MEKAGAIIKEKWCKGVLHMPEVTIDFTKEIGAIKPMHAVNNGPIKAKLDQTREILMRIPQQTFPMPGTMMHLFAAATAANMQ